MHASLAQFFFFPEKITTGWISHLKVFEVRALPPGSARADRAGATAVAAPLPMRRPRAGVRLVGVNRLSHGLKEIFLKIAAS